MDTTWPKLPAQDRANGFEITMSGWSWPHDINRSNARPSGILSQLEWVPGKPTEWSPVTRRRFLPVSRGWSTASIGSGTKALLTSIDQQILATGEGAAKHVTEDQVERILVDTIRSAATPGSGIGQDLMSVYLPIRGGNPRVRYFRTHSDSLAYSPAFILSEGIVYPSALGGPMRPQIGNVEIEAIPPYTGDGNSNSMSSQPRPPFQ
ncbi:hypothetical protein ABIC47_001105 [Leifsonia sp. 563]